MSPHLSILRTTYFCVKQIFTKYFIPSFTPTRCIWFLFTSDYIFVTISYCRYPIVLDWKKYGLLCNVRKWPLCWTEKVKAKISLHSCTVWSGPSLFVNLFNNVQWFYKLIMKALHTIPARPHNFCGDWLWNHFCGHSPPYNWLWNHFCGHSPPSADSRSYLWVTGKSMCKKYGLNTPLQIICKQQIPRLAGHNLFFLSLFFTAQVYKETRKRNSLRIAWVSIHS